MSSNEEYLDNLLATVMKQDSEPIQEAAEDKEENMDFEEELDLDALDDNVVLDDMTETEDGRDIDLDALDIGNNLNLEEGEDITEEPLEKEAIDEEPLEEESIVEEPVIEAMEAEEPDVDMIPEETVPDIEELPEETEPVIEEAVEDADVVTDTLEEELVSEKDSMDDEINKIMDAVSEEVEANDAASQEDFEKFEDELDNDLLDFSDIDDDSDISEISKLLDEEEDLDENEDFFDELAHAPKIRESAEETTAVEEAEPPKEEPVAEEKPKKAKRKKIRKPKVKKEKKPEPVMSDAIPKKAHKGVMAKFFKMMTEEDVIPEPTPEEIQEAKAAKEAKKQEAAEAKAAKKKEQDEAKAAKKKEQEEAKAQKNKEAQEKKKAKAEAKAAKLAEQKAKERGKKKKYVSKKKVGLIALFAATVLGAILFMVNSASVHGCLKRARDSFYAGDYATAYAELYGEKLNESDSIMYEKSKVVLRLERKLDAYVNNLKMGKDLQALNALIQGIGVYDRSKDEAVALGAINEADQVKSRILQELSDNYGIGEEQAEQLLQIQDEKTYTKTLNHIIMGENVALDDIESIVNDEKNASAQEESDYMEPEIVEEPDFDEELETLDEQ